MANHLLCRHCCHPRHSLSGIQVFPSSLAVYHLSDLLTELFIWGVAPKRRGTFVSAKVPKTMFARARPHGGSSASVPNNDGEGTRCAQTALAEKSIRYGGSAAPEGGKTLKKETNQVFKLGLEGKFYELNAHACPKFMRL